MATREAGLAVEGPRCQALDWASAGLEAGHLLAPGPLGTYHQLQRFVEESVALAVQVGVGAASFGHTDPGKAGLL